MSDKSQSHPDANLEAILATAEHDRERLNSNALGAFSLTLLGLYFLYARKHSAEKMRAVLAQAQAEGAAGS